jgi:hypothetical protein
MQYTKLLLISSRLQYRGQQGLHATDPDRRETADHFRLSWKLGRGSYLLQ